MYIFGRCALALMLAEVVEQIDYIAGCNRHAFWHHLLSFVMTNWLDPLVEQKDDSEGAPMLCTLLEGG